MAEHDKADSEVRMSRGLNQELGSLGLAQSEGQMQEQLRKELTFPESIDTYRQMYKDPLIYAAITLIRNMVSKTEFSVAAPNKADATQLERAKFIEECMEDLDGDGWNGFIKAALSYLIYGYSVTEKVFRRRNAKNGSKFDDNRIGWKKLASRSQRTIRKWEFSDDGRELTGVFQDLSMVINGVRYEHLINSPAYTSDGIRIPRNKFMLLTYDGHNGNPEGEPPLAACWVNWKYKNILEEQEAIGVSRDMVGMPVIGLHPKYMSPDATPEEQAVFSYYKKLLVSLHNNESMGAIVPLARDENGNKIVEFELMGVKGSKQHNTTEIIKRHEDKILTALFSDILKLGQDTHGSFSLAGAKTNITAVNIQARLEEIVNMINQDLIPQTFKLNGWDDKVFPKVQFGDLDDESVDEFSKGIQRLASVNFLPRDPKMVSSIIKRSGFDHYEDYANLDQEKLNALFTNNESGAGEGMKEGLPSGTGSALGDNTAINLDNEA